MPELWGFHYLLHELQILEPGTERWTTAFFQQASEDSFDVLNPGAFRGFAGGSPYFKLSKSELDRLQADTGKRDKWVQWHRHTGVPQMQEFSAIIKDNVHLLEQFPLESLDQLMPLLGMPWSSHLLSHPMTLLGIQMTHNGAWAPILDQWSRDGASPRVAPLLRCRPRLPSL